MDQSRYGENMKLGLLTAPLPKLSLFEIADWASAQGFEQLEVCCWPVSVEVNRRYAGITHIDVDNFTQSKADEIVGELKNRKITMSALGYYPNNLHPDEAHRILVNEHTKKTIRAAGMMAVPVISTFIGADSGKTQEENWVDAQKIWPDIVKYAEDNNVKIAIENCPMIFSKDEWPSGHNVAYSPKIWREMFAKFGPTVGLNLDPSHLVWQMIDIERVIREFGPRIYHTHVKDMEIDREGLYENGVMSGGIGWQRPRLPGYGEIDWSMFVATLSQVGYQGVLCVEHEDRRFEGSDELVKEGFLIARNQIAPLLPMTIR
jgi:sugar phosphate isomerase/epimerase